MANYFPPTSVYPKNYDSDYNLFLVYDTSETITTAENLPWSDTIFIKPVANEKEEIWANNGFANIDGELFYYDDVEKNADDKIFKLKRCARNLGGTHTKKTSAGTEVRGFVIAEHHNQIVDAILKIENFIGENFTNETATLDWRIRHLRSLDIIKDDASCPDITFDFYIISDDPTTGTIAEYSVIIDGTFTNYRLDFGDGDFTTTFTKGTHTYTPNSLIDPILTISNSKCELVQTPIEREIITEPKAKEAPTTFEIKIPNIPNIPQFNIPNIPIPSNIVNPPPIVFPYLNIGPVGSAIVPSVIVIEPPINIPSLIEITTPNIPTLIEIIAPVPSLVTFGPVSIPSVINFGPSNFTIPSLIKFGPVDIPTLIKIGPVGVIPSLIKFGPVSIPTLIKIDSTKPIPSLIVLRPTQPIPSVIVLVGPPVPSTITFGPTPVPTQITFSPISVPSYIRFAPFYLPSIIVFGPVGVFPSHITFGPMGSLPTLINFAPVSIPSTIMFGPVGALPSIIRFGSAPSLPTLITFSPVSIPSVIEFGPRSTVPSLINFGPSPSIPTLIEFSPAKIPTLIEFGPVGVIPTLIEFGPAPFVPTLIEFGPAPFVPTLIEFGPAPFVPSLIEFGPAPFVPTLIEFGPVPVININWGTPPTCSCTVAISCPSSTGGFFRSPSSNASFLGEPISEQINDSIDVQVSDLGIPSEILIKMPEIPDIRVIHDIPAIIRIEAPKIPDIKIIGPDTPLPQEIRIISDGIPSFIQLIANLPTSIKIDAMDIPRSIKLDFPDVFPTIKIDASGIPNTIQVVGIPPSIELIGPKEIKLVLPDKPEIEMVYKGSAIPLEANVKINLDISRLTGEDGNAQCVSIVPCVSK